MGAKLIPLDEIIRHCWEYCATCSPDSDEDCEKCWRKIDEDN